MGWYWDFRLDRERIRCSIWSTRIRQWLCFAIQTVIDMNRYLLLAISLSYNMYNIYLPALLGLPYFLRRLGTLLWLDCQAKRLLLL